MSDYDFEPRQPQSIYLKLKEKGDKVTIRICSVPYREPKVWKEGAKLPMSAEDMLRLSPDDWVSIFRDPDYNVVETFHWKVMDRLLDIAKIFTGTPGVYKNIKKYATMDAWGDPSTYDLEIERTEAPGLNYYAVTALPNKEKVLYEKEKAMLDGISMHEKLPAARKLTERQIDWIPEEDADPSKGLSNEPDKIYDDNGQDVNLPDEEMPDDFGLKD